MLTPDSPAARLQSRIDKKPKRRTASTAQRIKDAVAEIDRRIEEDDWAGLTATTFVQLWVWCHREIYGVDPTFNKTQWPMFRKQMGSVCKREFDGNFEAMLKYARWAWDREQSYEEWRRRTDKSTTPKTASSLFSTRLLTEYRVQCAREEGTD